MIYIAILPAWLLLAFIALAAYKLSVLRPKETGHEKYRLTQAIFFITLTQLAASLLSLYFTYDKSISWEACRLGLYGRYVSGSVLLLGVIVFATMFLRRMSNAASRFPAHKPFFIAALLSNMLAVVIFVRSFLRCTV